MTSHAMSNTDAESPEMDPKTDLAMERLMEAFSPGVRDDLERRHPEWAPLIEQVKTAAALLKRHENRAAWTGVGTVEYADWCFYPEPDGSVSRLIIYADLIPVRCSAHQIAINTMIQKLKECLVPLQYSLHHQAYVLTVLIPVPVPSCNS